MLYVTTAVPPANDIYLVYYISLRPRGTPLLSPVWSCSCTELFLIRGWDLILPWWLDEPQTISNHPEWGWGYHTVWGGIDTGDRRLRPWCEVVDV